MEFFYFNKSSVFFSLVGTSTVNCFVKGTCQIIEVPMQGYGIFYKK